MLLLCNNSKHISQSIIWRNTIIFFQYFIWISNNFNLCYTNNCYLHAYLTSNSGFKWSYHLKYVIYCNHLINNKINHWNEINQTLSYKNIFFFSKKINGNILFKTKKKDKNWWEANLSNCLQKKKTGGGESSRSSGGETPRGRIIWESLKVGGWVKHVYLFMLMASNTNALGIVPFYWHRRRMLYNFKFCFNSRRERIIFFGLIFFIVFIFIL